MADLQKAIKGLEDWIDTPFAMNAEIDPKLVHDALELLKERQWVPARERLPEYTGTFLVWVWINQCGEGMHMECRTAMFYYPTQRFYVHREAEGELKGSVEKWMPLPELPKE